MSDVDIDISKLEDVMWDSQELNELLKAKAQEINEIAADIYLVQKVKTREVPSKDTPPSRYIDSFKTKRVNMLNSRKSYEWIAFNDDPQASWIEFGAHAGGKTLVLKYRPYGRAVDILRARA